MRHEIISVSNNTNGNIKTYLLDDGEYERKGLVRPAVVICPGGGYTCVSANEGEPVAMFFNRHGYHAFVLDYSVKIENPFPTALKELATAMAYIRNHKAEWNISSVYLIGFSAGGNLALSLGVYGTSDMLTKEMGQLDFNKNAFELCNLIRGFNPWPLTYFYYNERRFKVFAADAVNIKSNREIGEFFVEGGNAFIACGEKTALIITLDLKGTYD